MAAYQKQLEAFRRLQADLIAVSVDSPPRSEKMKKELGLGFSLLSDPERDAIRAWSLLNRRERGGIAFPAVFVIDRAGRVVFRSLDRTHVRVDPAPVLTFLEERCSDPDLQRENETRTLQTPSVLDSVFAGHRKYLGPR